MNQAILVVTNVPDIATATLISRDLVEQNLAACVNFLPGVQSIYRWQGAVEEAQEITLLIKTMGDHYQAVESRIRTLHPYEIPEIIALPVMAGWQPYLHWIAGETKREGND